MTPIFEYRTNPDGKPVARPVHGVHAELATFLTEEASWSDYVGILQDLATEATTTGQPQVNTGNAYAVTISGASASIEHLHRAGHKPHAVPLAIFVQALREWRAFLDRTPA